MPSKEAEDDVYFEDSNESGESEEGSIGSYGGVYVSIDLGGALDDVDDVDMLQAVNDVLSSPNRDFYEGQAYEALLDVQENCEADFETLCTIPSGSGFPWQDPAALRGLFSSIKVEDNLPMSVVQWYRRHLSISEEDQHHNHDHHSKGLQFLNSIKSAIKPRNIIRKLAGHHDHGHAHSRGRDSSRVLDEHHDVVPHHDHLRIPGIVNGGKIGEDPATWTPVGGHTQDHGKIGGDPATWTPVGGHENEHARVLHDHDHHDNEHEYGHLDNFRPALGLLPRGSMGAPAMHGFPGSLRPQTPHPGAFPPPPHPHQPQPQQYQQPIQSGTYTGSLGYGIEGDACLMQNYPSLSQACKNSFQELGAVRTDYISSTVDEEFMGYADSNGWHEGYSHHHGHPIFMLLIIGLIGYFMYQRHQKMKKIRRILTVIEGNPSLKAQVESAAGCEIPPHSKMLGGACGAVKCIAKACGKTVLVVSAFFFVLVTSITIAAIIVKSMGGSDCPPESNSNDCDHHGGPDIGGALLVWILVAATEITLLGFFGKAIRSRCCSTACADNEDDADANADTDNENGPTVFYPGQVYSALPAESSHGNSNQGAEMQTFAATGTLHNQMPVYAVKTQTTSREVLPISQVTML